MLFDYEALKLICWVVVGLFLIGFVVINGIDMGTGILLPVMAKSDTDRWVIVNAFGPHRTRPHKRGNQIWLVAVGVAVFAAWPPVLVITYRGFSLTLLVTFAVYFLRPVGMVYRNKLEATRWGSFWDWEIFLGSIVPPLVFGVIFGNLLVGLPYQMDEFLQVNYAGSIWALLNPLALLFGFVFVAMVVTQGATWLQFKTSDYIYERARIATVIAALVSSLTVWDATSSAKMLSIMLGVAIVFFSVVVSYALWWCVRMFAQIREREIRVKQYSLN